MALAACSTPPPANPPVDVNAAAAKAQGDIDTYAANTLAARPAAANVVAPAPAPTSSASVAEAPISADGAAKVAQSYFALLEARKYDQAYQLWDDAGMTVRQFADSFAKYAEYHARVGAPGRVDAGAGQRYVEVPVNVYGTLAAGRQAFAMQGTLTLHRTADIDGATAEQRRWRIRDSSLRPRPAAAAQPVAATVARYRCAGASRISVRFDNDADTATVRRGERDLAVLAGQRPASGIWYKGGGYELRGKGDDADFTAPGRPPVACTAAD